MSQVVCSKPVLIHWVIGDCLLTLVQTCAYAAGKNISNQCKNVKQDIYIYQSLQSMLLLNTSEV